MYGNAFIRHFYKIEREKKQYSVYQLTGTIVHQRNNFVETNPVLTGLVRIEKDRHYHHSKGFDEWLRIRTTSNWQTSDIVTGLMITNRPGVYFGDYIHNKQKNLLIFRFNEDRTQLTIDFYIGYCPYRKPVLTPSLERILSNYNK